VLSLSARVVLPDAGCPIMNVIDGLIAFLTWRNTSV